MLVWLIGGSWCPHSIDVGIWEEKRTTRFEISLSHKMKMKKMTASIDNVEPREEMTFHEV